VAEGRTSPDGWWIPPDDETTPNEDSRQDSKGVSNQESHAAVSENVDANIGPSITPDAPSERTAAGLGPTEPTPPAASSIVAPFIQAEAFPAAEPHAPPTQAPVSQPIAAPTAPPIQPAIPTPNQAPIQAPIQSVAPTPTVTWTQRDESSLPKEWPGLQAWRATTAHPAAQRDVPAPAPTSALTSRDTPSPTQPGSPYETTPQPAGPGSIPRQPFSQASLASQSPNAHVASAQRTETATGQASTTATTAPASTSPASTSPANPFEQRATSVLALAILGLVLSITCVGGLFAPVAWIMGNGVRSDARATGWPEPRKNRVGRLMAIVVTLLGVLAVLGLFLYGIIQAAQA
jgi:hypothetical protein